MSTLVRGFAQPGIVPADAIGAAAASIPAPSPRVAAAAAARPAFRFLGITTFLFLSSV
jgi:hypothetical protein